VTSGSPPGTPLLYGPAIDLLMSSEEEETYAEAKRGGAAAPNHRPGEAYWVLSQLISVSELFMTEQTGQP
jgi:hypothetical protein